NPMTTMIGARSRAESSVNFKKRRMFVCIAAVSLPPSWASVAGPGALINVFGLFRQRMLAFAREKSFP
ncbi:MAG: hypothetical protein QF546_05415, partial [Alphaproteobacteria bacterium]|nr:hypothetical protein [Alphaproteobacteria bacterium]